MVFPIFFRNDSSGVVVFPDYLLLSLSSSPSVYPHESARRSARECCAYIVQPKFSFAHREFLFYEFRALPRPFPSKTCSAGNCLTKLYSMRGREGWERNWFWLEYLSFALINNFNRLVAAELSSHRTLIIRRGPKNFSSHAIFNVKINSSKAYMSHAHAHERSAAATHQLHKLEFFPRDHFDLYCRCQTRSTFSINVWCSAL